MNKLKNKKTQTIINLNIFLKNNYLKKYKLKRIVFEDKLLYSNKYFNLIEFNNYENMYIPKTVKKFNNIYTVKSQYNDQIICNYNLTYYLLINFNQIMLKYLRKKIIKGRLLNNYKSYINILIFGKIISMRTFYLNELLSKKKKFSFYNKYYIKKNKKFFNFVKKLRPFQLIRRFYFEPINLKFEISEKTRRFYLKRSSYLQDIIVQQEEKVKKHAKLLTKLFSKKKKKKKPFSRKIFVQEKKKKSKD